MAQIIMLALDGEAIPLKEILVTPQMQIPDKDQSGQASSTATAEQGVKAKELRISGVIPFKTPEVLSRLYALAEAKGSNGAMKRYRVANKTAQLVNFREGMFSGSIDAAPQTNKMAWLVNFTLKEQDSVAEKAAARTAGSVKNKTQTAKGASGTPGAAAGEEGKQELTSFEKFLKKIDDKLA
ncbi:baseplate complex protein [Serratia liquefaciens]|uniref:baseplate complex protein n=1 Tax=Serratia liquefaciens TaxID=614 RepID=UPI000DFAA4A0|nr:hypothetical protein [Serratia liquefaciens]SUI62337.1 Uncharacterised protein [Serratia liquefaciens]